MMRLQTCCTEDAVNHDLFQTSDRFVYGFGNKNAFACSQTAGFEDDLKTACFDVLGRFIELGRREGLVFSGRYRVSFHEILGERFRSFHSGGKLRGSKDRYSGWMIAVFQSCIVYT